MNRTDQIELRLWVYMLPLISSCIQVRQTRISIVDYQKRYGGEWFHRPREPQLEGRGLNVSGTPSSCARISLTALKGVTRREERPRHSHGVSTRWLDDCSLRWILELFSLELQALVNFRCLRFSLSLLFLRNFKLSPQRNDFPLQPHCCFSFVLNPKRSAKDGIFQLFARLRVALAIFNLNIWVPPIVMYLSRK